MSRVKYKWYPHVIMNDEQYRSVHRRLMRIYERYKTLLDQRFHSKNIKKLPVSMWIFQNYVLVKKFHPQLTPYCLLRWIEDIPNVVSVSHVVVDTCTLCVVEYTPGS